MKEIEVKIRYIDKEKIIEKIEALGAKKVFTGKVIDYRFDTPERDLSRQGKALRIRQKGKYIYLNLKGKKKSIQSIVGRDEIGVKISNFKTMHRILNDLGFIKIFDLRKYRTEYRLDDIVFDIDEYVGLDPMLEIESDSYEKVQKYIDLLEIKEEDVGRIYIREILAAKKKVDYERNMKNPNFRKKVVEVSGDSEDAVFEGDKISDED
ncbi:MAG: class IV adenylate cyclase [Nanoarchaeales archaeon]|nr:class IV adenylate cyclase [Nanoarchaeales archaeon]